MQKLILTLAAPFLGLALYAGVSAVPAFASDVPNYNTLYQQGQQQAQDQVNASLSANPTPTAQTLSAQANSSTTAAPTDQNVIVLNTGDNTKLDTSNNQTSNTTVTNNNNATVNQTVNTSANTGNNTADRNISIGGNAGTIQTGNASVNSGESSSVNSNPTAISGVCPNVVSNVTAYNTGDNFDQHSGTNSTCNTTVTNNNNATINQVVNSDANTGGNSAQRNIAIGGGSAGQIVTGNASVGSLVTTDANHNQVVIVGGSSSNGGPGSGANIYVLNTADNADLSAYQNRTSTNTVTNNNTYVGNQVVNASADTGHNTADRNINTNGDAGVIHTGDATVNTVLGASANSNNTVIAGDGGNATTNVNLINTGDNLHSDTNTSVNNNTTVTNNNTAVVNQTVNASANTGYNDASRNIAFGGNAGEIVTGNATVNTALVADVNQNRTAISGVDGTATSNVNAINTGDNAQINANSTTNNSVVVTNNNLADINQVANVNANTGYNEANRNIGGGSITTGGVTVNTLAVDHANGNYTFVVDSSSTAQSVFNQFVQSLFGVSLGDILANNQNVNNVNVANTGDNAVVLAQNSTVRRVVVTNNNVSDINQFVNVNANTGNNQCNRNIGGCDIVTGNVVVTTTLLANSNFNFTVIGKVEISSTPVTPETPETPQQPVTPAQPQAVEAAQAPALLAAVTAAQSPQVLGASLPNTGANNFGYVGLLLIAAGALLRRKAQPATVKE